MTLQDPIILLVTGDNPRGISGALPLSAKPGRPFGSHPAVRALTLEDIGAALT